MRVDLLAEPDLEFGCGTHLDIRHGIKEYGPVGCDRPTAKRRISIAIIGTAFTVDQMYKWLQRTSAGVKAKDSKRERFFSEFPGFGLETCFQCEWVSEPRLSRIINGVALSQLLSKSRADSIVDAADLFYQECCFIDKTAPVDVIICVPPMDLLAHLDQMQDEDQPSALLDFHDLLKAKSLQLKAPLQFVRPHTYSDSNNKDLTRQTQDEATRAWNFYTALYYKAGGTPWRLLRKTSDLESCFVGIGFFHNLEKTKVQTSLAQVFNERGDGMVLLGGEAEKSKDDRQPHLLKKDMQQLMENALDMYKLEHSHLPARLVVHKTSEFTLDETEACILAMRKFGIMHCDILSIHPSAVRLVRHGSFPPLRGTYLQLDDKSIVLYTKGSVQFFEMYPGPYVPRAIEIKLAFREQPPDLIAQEVLALTKMNWNNTQFDSAYPITIRAARQVGTILKYVTQDNVQQRYAYYM